MATPLTALDADWLAACRRATAGLQELLAAAPTTAQRSRETGTRGSGGDRTLVIDADAEAIVFAQLEALSAEGFRFHALSEERGEVDFGDRRVRVIIDPIDGSLNAKRHALHYALSVAVADGETAADVTFAFVHDFGSGEEWSARRGEGAYLDGVRLDPELPERRSRDGKLELLGIESGGPALGRGGDRRPAGERPPAAGDGDDRQHPVPGRGGALRRDGDAAPLPGRRRRGGSADRPRGRWDGRVHRLPRPARRPAGHRAALAADRRAQPGGLAQLRRIVT